MEETPLDLRGLKCPLPVLRAAKRLRSMAPGAVLRVEVTDPQAPADFRAFCDSRGHALESEERDGETYVLRLRKGRASSGR